MKKVFICLLIMLSIILSACNSTAKLMLDCSKDMATFEEKLEKSNSAVINMNMEMFLDEESMLEMLMEYKMIEDPFYIEIKADEQEYHLVTIGNQLFNIELINDKYVAERIGDMSDLEQYYDVDIEEQMEIKDLASIEIEKIKNGYRLKYDLVEYLENSDNETLKSLFSNINEDYIESATVSIDIIFDDDVLKMNCLYNVDLKILAEEHNMQVKMDFDISIEEVEPLCEDYWISVYGISTDMYDPNIIDFTGYNKFYFPMASSGIFKMYLEEGVYGFNTDSDTFDHIIFDANYNQYNIASVYYLKEGYYYIYLFDFPNKSVEIIKY